MFRKIMQIICCTSFYNYYYLIQHRKVHNFVESIISLPISTEFLKLLQDEFFPERKTLKLQNTSYW